MCGSYNQLRAKVHIDAHIVSIIDFLTSLIASVVIFSSLGHSAHLVGVPVDQVAKGGAGPGICSLSRGLVTLASPSPVVSHLLPQAFLAGAGLRDCPVRDSHMCSL